MSFSVHIGPRRSPTQATLPSSNGGADGNLGPAQQQGHLFVWARAENVVIFWPPAIGSAGGNIQFLPTHLDCVVSALQAPDQFLVRHCAQ